MATITEVKDRTTCTCTGMSQAAFEVHTTDRGTAHEYRIREWAYRGVWQLQRLREGATGAGRAARPRAGPRVPRG
jgi:hypothetical protein